jgi:hypothetical protein
VKGYRVIFENNIPVFARQIDIIDSKEVVKLSREGNKRLMNWFVVYGDNETDAIEIAKKVLKTIWAEYLA